MDAVNTGFETSTGPTAQSGQDALYTALLARAKALAEGDLAGADELLDDIVTADLPEAAFGPLADAIAAATKLKAAEIAGRLRDGREARVANRILAAGVPGLDDIPHVMGRLAAGLYLNALLGFTLHWGGVDGPPTYFVRNRDGSVSPVKKHELQEILANKFVRTLDDKGKDGRMPAALWWMASKDRYDVEVVEYDPERVLEKNGVRIENTWHGFAIRPAKGSWKRIRHHLLHVVCGGNRKCYSYLIKWLAHAVQFPGTPPEVVVVIRSTEEGAGKSVLGEYILKPWFGKHALVINSADAVLGQFNDAVVNKSIIVLEESGFPGDHRWAAALRYFITARHHSINPKGLRRYEIPNLLHLLILGNSLWTIPAGARARRFFMLDIAGKPPPRAYFDRLHAEIGNGGAEAMLHDLLELDLSGFHPRDVPITAALVQQQRLSADPITRWAQACVVAEAIAPGFPYAGNGGFGETLKTAALYQGFLNWTRNQGILRPPDIIEFGKSLRALGMTPDPSHANGRGWRVPDAATLLAKAQERAGIQKPTV
jgi:hypothetical protein